MKLKIRTTAGAALGVAAMAAALSIGCGTLLNLGLPRILIVTGSVFTAMYLTARFCFNLFVRYRIKPIYQVLLSKNVKTHELPPAGDLVEEIQDELNLWPRGHHVCQNSFPLRPKSIRTWPTVPSRVSSSGSGV